jgi:hypothetical protein
VFFSEGQVRVFVYGQPTSMRLSFDGLYALTRHTMGLDPMSGHLFAFINDQSASQSDQGAVLGPVGVLRVGQALGAGTTAERLVASGHTRDGLDGLEVIARRHRE